MKTLANLLIDEKIVTKEKMDIAIKEQEKNGGVLGLILLSKGFISREKLVEYISHPDTSHF